MSTSPTAVTIRDAAPQTRPAWSLALRNPRSSTGPVADKDVLL